MEPRTRTDEEAAREPLRTVIPIRGAVIGVVAVITRFADWGTIGHGSRDDLGTNPHAYSYLSVGR
jgi:hypothetical protein